MQCPERTRRLDHFERTARAYAEAIGGLRDLQGYDLIAQERLVHHIREACDAAAAALADHQQSHGCARAGVHPGLENKVA
jgi:hypothetical protein